MEFIGLLLFLLAVVIFIGSILGFVAMAQASALRKDLARLRSELEALRRTGVPTPPAPPVRAPEPVAGAPPTPPPAAEPRRPIEEILTQQAARRAAAAPPPPLPPAAAPLPEQEPPALPPFEPVVPADDGQPPAWGRSLGDLFRDAEWTAKLEDVVGKRWMVWAGGLAVFAAVGFFVKYAVENDWVNPAARIISGLILGTAMLVAGDRFVRRDMRPLGLGLIGAAGLPILYVSLFSAFHAYHLVPQPAAFAAMVLVTVAGMCLAVFHDSLAVSFLAVLGGLLTPLLVSTGQDSRDALFAYLLILDLGVLGVAFVKRWRALDILAFVGTTVMFAGWFAQFYAERAMVPTLLWLGAFYLAFLVMPFAWHLREGVPAPLERFVMALVVAAGVFGYAWAILHEPWHRPALGFIALGMGACYVTIGSLARKRIPTDARGVFGFLALAMLFLTLAVPLHLKLNGITLAWAAEAVVLLYLGYRFAYLPVRLGGLAVLGLAVGRLFAHHWPLHEEAAALLVNTQFGIAAFVCLAVGAFAAVHHRWQTAAAPADRVIKIICGIVAGVLGLVMLHAEVGSWLAFRAKDFAAPADYLAASAGVVVWALGSLAFLAAGWRARCLAARLSAAAALVVAAIGLAMLYNTAMPEAYRFFLNARFLVSLAVVAAAFSHAFLLDRWREGIHPGELPLIAVFGIAAGALLLVVIHVDLADWLCAWGRYTVHWGTALLWAAGALGFLAAGLKARSQAARLAGLGALGVAAILCMLLFGDVAPVGHTDFFNARFVVGLLMVSAGIGYGHALRRFPEISTDGEGRIGEALYLAAGVALLLIVGFDLDGLLGRAGPYYARCGLAILWTLGAAGFLAAGLAWRALARRIAGLAVLAVALVLAAGLYESGLIEKFTLYVNLRFIACLAAVLMVFAFAWVPRHFFERCSGEEQRLAKALYWIGGLLLLIALSVDAWLYAVKTAGDPAKARWASQMALSIIWSLYAVATLAVGFWKRARAVRLVALGLFGITALKLVIVDIAHIQQIYRILSFFVIGILMIAASYLYHRIEKRLQQQWGEDE